MLSQYRIKILQVHPYCETINFRGIISSANPAYVIPTLYHLFIVIFLVFFLLRTLENLLEISEGPTASLSCSISLQAEERRKGQMSQIPESRRLLAGLLSSEKKTKAGFKRTVKKERTGRQTMENQLHAQMFSRASKVSLDGSVLLVRRNNFGSQECIQTSVMNICPVQSTLHTRNRCCSVFRANHCAMLQFLQRAQHHLCLIHWDLGEIFCTTCIRAFPFFSTLGIQLMSYVDTQQFGESGPDAGLRPCSSVRTDVRGGRDQRKYKLQPLNCCVLSFRRESQVLGTGETGSSAKGRVLTCVYVWGKAWSLHTGTCVRHEQTWRSQ